MAARLALLGALAAAGTEAGRFVQHLLGFGKAILDGLELLHVGVVLGSTCRFLHGDEIVDRCDEIVVAVNDNTLCAAA